MSLASPPPAAAVKPRKKLQKSGAKLPRRPSNAAAAEPPAPEHKGWRLRGQTKQQQQPAAAQQQQPKTPDLQLPPDLSDSKWLEYIRKSGHLVPLDTSPAAAPRREAPAPAPADSGPGRRLVPEFAHLAAASPQPPAPPPPPRGSPDSAGPRGPSADTARAVRRQAKTPVLEVGQLEGDALRGGRAAAQQQQHAPGGVSGVELIAEQYRALLASRNSMLFSSHLEPTPWRQGGGGGGGGGGAEAADPRSGSPEELPPARTRAHADDQGAQPPPDLLPGGSPASSDGTLVAFEEERVYFKPISFSPEPASPAFPEAAAGRPPPSPPYDDWWPAPSGASGGGGGGSLGLEICLDLLVRELAPAAADASPLQVWAMIEAYERLRDRVGAGAGAARGEDAGALEAALDTWLRALYALHDRMAGLPPGDGGSDSGSEYDVAERGDA